MTEGDRKALAIKALAAANAAGVPRRQTTQLWADMLAEVPLFAGVPKRLLRKLARAGTVERFDPNEPIVTAGRRGEAFYIVLSGRASVRRGRGRRTVEIGPGGYFGEMALIDSGPRSATVVAKSEIMCLLLGREQFGKALESEPSIAFALLRTLAARIRELQESPTD